jgi:hypothetical protein
MGFLETPAPPMSLAKLRKVIFCLNIRDHEGKIYFPEVMWSVFYSVVGFNDSNKKRLQRYKANKLLLKRIKNKYKNLGKTLTMDDLCGNIFYKTEFTITHYLAGRLILNGLKNLVKNKKEGVQTISRNKTNVFHNSAGLHSAGLI